MDNVSIHHLMMWSMLSSYIKGCSFFRITASAWSILVTRLLVLVSERHIFVQAKTKIHLETEVITPLSRYAAWQIF